MLIQPKKILLLGLGFSLLMTLNACVYLTERQQGNILIYEDVQKIQMGSTQAEVQATLGHPLLIHPFNPKKWIYVFQKRQTDGSYFKQHLIVDFNNQLIVQHLDKRNIKPQD